MRTLRLADAGYKIYVIEEDLRFAGGATIKGSEAHDEDEWQYPIFIVKCGDIEIEGVSIVEASFIRLCGYDWGDEVCLCNPPGNVSISGTGQRETKLIGIVATLAGNIEFKGNVTMEQSPLDSDMGLLGGITQYGVRLVQVIINRTVVLSLFRDTAGPSDVFVLTLAAGEVSCGVRFYVYLRTRLIQIVYHHSNPPPSTKGGSS